MTKPFKVPDWKNADPEELEPHFSRWMLELTAQGLHAKSDIAIVLAMLSAQVAELKKDAEQRNVVYMSCQKHMGQVWNFTVKTHIPAKIICPLCDAAKEEK